MHKKFLSLILLLATATGVAMAQDGPRYGIKSGILTQKSDMGETTVYFDNYGALEAQKMKMNFMGMETAMTILSKDGKTYMINESEKQVQEIPASGSQVNFLKLTDAIKTANKIQEVGKETVLGRECTKYTLEASQMGMTMKQTVWIWQGIALKSLTDGGQFQMTTEAVKFEENVEIPASTFDVPKF
ncbi:MAG: DUF4412 domain-containing protein [Bacteroidales bacterium]|nr:DUF4412 domain-containing protein [Bacteroidales bacterium]